MHRSQPQHHLSFPSHEFFPSKAVGFNTAANPVTEIAYNLVFGLLEI
jgi:hypothetical protein